jgi:hypothetical protein
VNLVKVTPYALAALTCIGCAVLLIREYLRRRVRLLLWATVCFVALAINNVLLFFDRVVLPQNDLRLVRLGTALIGMMCLLYAFIWDSDRS